ncbi:MAG: class A beta-lactamase-related serine hydrolase [Acidobacteriota bacterium]|nr:class A beta-lactamase-related serine hydrolase [Acidobacteriota bacterium]
MSRSFAIAFLVASGLFAQDGVKDLASHFDGRVSIYAKNLKTGQTYDLGGGNRVNTASTIKLAILIGVFTAIQEGRAKWTDVSELTPENKVAGSGVLQEMSDGAKVPLRDLIRYMMLLSDNTATNLVLDHVSGNDVNAVMVKLGIKDTRSLRKILKASRPEGVSDAGRDPANAKFGIGVATPREMVSLLERLYRGELVSKEASAAMLDIMKKQIWRDGMPRRFDSVGVDVADKPGALEHLRSDVGIVYAKAGPVAIAITCEDIPKGDWSPDNAGYLFIADVSKLLVEELTK